MLCPNVDNMLERSLASVLSSPACTICKDAPEECFATSQAMWTNHCLQEGDSNFPPTLYTEDTDVVVQKGGNHHVDAYSAFMDHTKKLKTPLDSILKDNGISTIYMVGIATDYCVYFSAIDALSFGYDVKIVLDATRGIAQETIESAKADMISQGATIINSDDVLSMECPSPLLDNEETSGGTRFTTAIFSFARIMVATATMW
mmetsp:Transcript_22039/g.63194  ORF Transcript_22039/g.63194 Transcript_22039/m.63194 type:complete len:203 (-) Transcript_22039:116-724(-)